MVCGSGKQDLQIQPTLAMLVIEEISEYIPIREMDSALYSQASKHYCTAVPTKTQAIAMMKKNGCRS
jgi:hypothetical protein